MFRINYIDLVGRLLLVVLGAAASMVAIQNYPLGSVQRMEPGMFPTLLGVVLAGLGVLLSLQGLRRTGDRPDIHILSPLFVLGGVASSMLFPLNFHPEPTTALIMLAGIWYGTPYGGSTASILPGTPANAVTCLDGYPMAQNGRDGAALFMTTMASFFGASFGIILLTMFTPIIAEYALRFGSAEYFALMLMGLVAASTISEGSAFRGVAMLRGSSMGSFFGTLSGKYPSIAAYLSYTIEKRLSRPPEGFGKGAIESIMAPEAVNNAADQPALIPTLSLGVPWLATMALMLGVLMIHGAAPGPNLISSQPELFWGLIMSFWFGNLVLSRLNIPLIGVWVQGLTILYHILYPSVLMFICIGAYTSGFSVLNVWIVFALGCLGYVMRVFQFPGAPLLLGFVLAPLIDEHFRRAMELSRGDFMIFFERSISAVIMALTGLVLIWGVVSAERLRKRRLVSEGEVDHTPGTDNTISQQT